ncbi:MAG: hypothetical protein ACRDQH_02400 [Pseudonocardiaceae bacterium]
MTTVDQVVQAPALIAARRRAEQIRTHVEDVKGLIVEAYQARDWETLGYANWADYCTDEFGGTIAIPREERGDVVFTLRHAGLSTRAIGAAIGVAHDTVRRDLSGGRDRPPDPVPDLDDEVVDAEIVEEPSPPTQADEPARVTGTDGKSYRKENPPVSKAYRFGEDHDVIAKMAGEGATTRQILAQLGRPAGSEQGLRQYCKRHGIDVHADTVVGKIRRPVADRIIAETVRAAEGAASSLDLIEWVDADPLQFPAWVESLTRSIRALTRMRNTMQELVP